MSQKEITGEIENQGVSPIGFLIYKSHTPCGRLTLSFPQGDCDLQINVEQLYLKCTLSCTSFWVNLPQRV